MCFMINQESGYCRQRSMRGPWGTGRKWSVLVAGIREDWGQKWTSELHLTRQGERILIREGVFQEEGLVSKGRQS